MADDDTDLDLDGFAGGGSGGTAGPAGGRDASESGRSGRWLWLLVGVALGVAASLLVPRYVAPHLPAALGGGLVSVQGEVLDKERESGRLLLTLDSDRGAMLATFRDRISELDLLIGRGDSVTLAMAEFRPFVDDPTLVGVKKGKWEGRVPATPDAAAESDTAEAGEAGTDGGPEGDRGGGERGDAAPPPAGADTADAAAGPPTPSPAADTAPRRRSAITVPPFRPAAVRG